MSKSIYEDALEAYGHVSAIVQNKKSHLTWEQEVHHLANITRALQHAQKQEQEHIEYSKKVQEQFSNDTKRIGELKSKLIRQEQLLKLYKELSSLLLIQRNYKSGSPAYYELDSDIYDIRKRILEVLQ